MVSAADLLRLIPWQQVVRSQCGRASYTQSQRSLSEAQRKLLRQQAFLLSCLRKNSGALMFVAGFEKEEFPPREFWQKESKNHSEVRQRKAHFR